MAGVLISNFIYLRKRKYNAAPANKPFLSILIPARNETENLKRLIPSILSQSYCSYELIVYDDASEDETTETINSFDDHRIRALKGNGPPAGWAGKVHALYAATREANGDAFLFLDADTSLKHTEALEYIVNAYVHAPAKSVITGLPDYKGKGLSLVSLAAHSLLATLPWYLAQKLPYTSLTALNGQCWMIDAATYRELEPHKAVASEVLEDVLIGRYLKKKGYSSSLVDLQDELSVYMYDSFTEAWRGFRKNVFPLMGNSALNFTFVFLLYAIVFVIPPFLDPRLLLLVFANKWAADWRGRFSIAISIITPLCYLFGSTLQLDSAWNHLTGKVKWKGRPISLK